LVNFIGDNSHARLTKEKVWDFDEKFKEYAKQTKSKKLINSIKIANLIKNGLTNYEEEMNKLKLDKKRKIKRSNYSPNSSPESTPRKKRKLLQFPQIKSPLIFEHPPDKKPMSLEKRAVSSEGENILQDDFLFQDNPKTMTLESTINTSKETTTDDNLDYLLFSGEFERISRSKAKELNIEHKLTAPLQLENKGVLKKTTQKIREKFMKKTNSFKPKKIKEKKEIDNFFDENVALESIVNELNENFWEIEKNSKKKQSKQLYFQKT
jgi:hypothetical protein